LIKEVTIGMLPGSKKEVCALVCVAVKLPNICSAWNKVEIEPLNPSPNALYQIKAQL